MSDDKDDDDDEGIGGFFNPLNWFHSPFGDNFFEFPSLDLKNFIILACILAVFAAVVSNFKFTRKF